jgi:nitrogen fixation NifU-like protein
MHISDEGHGLDHAPQSMDARFWGHARFPQNTQALKTVDAEATATGSCGDAIRIRLQIENGDIAGVQQIPDGCVYTVACASAVSALVRGVALETALDLQPDQVAAELGGLPEDHLHCARLAVNTVGEAIANYYERLHRRPALSAEGHTPQLHPNGGG